MPITRAAVEAGAEALYRETNPKISVSKPFSDRSLLSKERYGGVVRAALIADMDSRSIDEVAEAIYISMDTKNAAERPFELRKEGSKERYRDLARAILQAAT